MTDRAPSTDRRVSWVGGAPGADEAEGLLHDALVRRGLSREEDVVAFLADGLFRRDFARGDRVADAGFFHRLYLRRARGILDSLDGRLVRIG